MFFKLPQTQPLLTHKPLMLVVEMPLMEAQTLEVMMN
jgi:hypothetical protein